MQTWLAPPRETLTEADVRAAISLEGRAPKIRHGVDVLDSTDTPVEGEALRVPADAGDVFWSYRPKDRVTGQDTQVADTRRTASLTVVGPTAVPLATRRFRIWTEWLAPTGVWVRFHLGVFLPTVPPIDDDGTIIRYQLKLADKTWRWGATTLTNTLTVPAGTNPVQWVKDDLTSRFGETAFSITTTTVTLTEPMTFQVGDSVLAVYNALLKKAAYDDLTADENGRPASVPLAELAGRGSEHTYGPAAGKIMTAGAVEPLLPTLPNVVRFVARQGPSLAEEGNGIRTKFNQSTGPASIDERGETVEMRVEVDAGNQAELETIATADAQRYFAGGGDRFVGQVGLNPRHGDRDIVTLNKPRLGLAGLWQVTSWQYPLRAITGEGAVLMPMTFERKVVVS